jgi:hypothetical protein
MLNVCINIYISAYLAEMEKGVYIVFAAIQKSKFGERA